MTSSVHHTKSFSLVSVSSIVLWSSFSNLVSLHFCCFECVLLCCAFCGPNCPYSEVNRMILTKQYRCVHSASCQCTKGHQVLWKEFCKTRAPKMMLDLQSSGSHSVDGNWRALGKLLIFCSGCRQGGLFNNVQVPGHFVNKTRFSRTSGKSFLMPQCINDVLYVSDPCEHIGQSEEGDLGFFRGIFKSFASSNVKRMLINRGAQLHQTEICPYCKAKLWSMLQANMIPQTASCRLGSYEDYIEYYVCLNGHLLGVCTLLPLSDSEDVSEE
ncbi:EID1-like F-box protein 2 [Glycine max]|uniref:EID1-like F-box protein 2 n=2 Tax=Glycine subgen. Soja TaxID=1462606 RepID=K7MW68_SOYBN|nr:EID1-like F-box protein 2 [Glycine max]